MKIVIMRHGKPDVPRFEKLKACELYTWIESYNAAGILQKQRPPVRTIEMVARCKAVVCSDFPRSTQSAAALNVKVLYSESLFREISLPYAKWNSLRFSPYVWAVFFRILWSFGYSSNGESFRSFQLRARTGAQKLKQIAREHGSVLFVGHGLINHFIAKELLSSGWQGPTSPGRKYWAFGVYTYNARRA